MNTTERTLAGRRKYALHAALTNDDKLRILKRANAILLAGYPVSKAERRVGYNIDDMRKWAEDLEYPLKVTKLSKYKARTL
jgi:hypothetical protein